LRLAAIFFLPRLYFFPHLRFMSSVIAFSQCDAAVIAFIRSANKSLRIVVCWFTHPDILRAMQERMAAGVELTLLLNFDQVNFQPQGLDFFAVEQAGAQVFGFTGPELLHHKFAIADEKRVLAGSFNWTRAAHQDHVWIQEDPAAAQVFTAEFERLKTQCKSLSALCKTPPRTVSFQQMHQPVWWSFTDFRQRIISGAKIWTTAFAPAHAGVWKHCLQQQRHVLMCTTEMSAFWQQNRYWDETAFRQWMQENAALRGIRLLSTYCLRVRPGDVLLAVQPPVRLLGIGIIGSDPEPAALPGAALSRYVPWLRLPENAACSDPTLTASTRALRRYAGSGLRMLEELRSFWEGG
jgi:mitochondrial cardiolipin hydrolase